MLHVPCVTVIESCGILALCESLWDSSAQLKFKMLLIANTQAMHQRKDSAAAYQSLVVSMLGGCGVCLPLTSLNSELGEA
mmetsp:Transcript_19733/g.49305  ORF Transcript_19733/g.49305 Transcript_19733/m.49305 type:complete len:80 (+) Transcript_19733:418-657(+)